MTMKRFWTFAFAILACLMFAWATGAGRPYPASAGGVVDPTCTSSLPCIEYDNNGTGPGIRGISVVGNGLSGSTKNHSTSTTNGRAGVFGNDVGTGNTNSGVHGQSVNGIGVFGVSTNVIGVLGQGTTGVVGEGNGSGVEGFLEGTLVGLRAAVIGLNTPDPTSTAIYADGSGGLLFDGNSAVGSDVFTVDNSGNVFAQTFTSFAAAATGQKMVTYAPQASQPTIEDFGEAQLTNGSAYVRLESRFGTIMARGLNYLVFITPEGDNRGLYVTQKSATGFAVRESQGGKSTLAFSYRIVAQPLGNHRMRLPLIDLQRRSKLVPRSPRRLLGPG